jgi:hydroxymethylglutaryl-CoA reductase
VDAAVNLILRKLDIKETAFDIRVRSSLPRGMGLGSSAAIAVAITRAIGQCMEMVLSPEAVNAIAFECEMLAHGKPSGIDNTISCYAEAMLFKNAGKLEITSLGLDELPPLVVGFSHESGATIEQVSGVRQRYEAEPARFDQVFDLIDELSISSGEALQTSNYEALGRLMNIGQGLLNALGISTPDLENMVAIARQSGALGAKLTGAGGGGSIVALCPGTEEVVSTALRTAGYATLDSRHLGRVQRG